jgi:hypothetical protein
MHNRNISNRMMIQVVATSAVALFIIFGIRLSFSVFFAEFISVEGWSSAQGSSIAAAVGKHADAGRGAARKL